MNRRILTSVAYRAFSQGPAKTPQPSSAASSSTPSSSGINANVPGLSTRVVENSKEKVGPGAAANADYKVPEYYLFNRFSFAEAEIEMAKYRLPQPSALE